MRRLILKAVFLSVVIYASPVLAGESFSGTWTIDLRSTAEKNKNTECGSATFELIQTGDQIVGNHYMATPDCGRLNEGGRETVKGVVVGGTAVLVVTSGRNGAIVMGIAKLVKSSLVWKTLDEIRAGEPDGDLPLILGDGILSKISPK